MDSNTTTNPNQSHESKPPLANELLDPRLQSGIDCDSLLTNEPSQPGLDPELTVLQPLPLKCPPDVNTPASSQLTNLDSPVNGLTDKTRTSNDGESVDHALASSRTATPNRAHASVKRRRIGSPSGPLSEKPITSPLRSLSSIAPSPTQSTLGDLNLQVGKVIWVDIGCTPSETYWWPGVIGETQVKTDSEENHQEGGSKKLEVELFAESKGKRSKALAEPRRRPLASFNKVQAFVLDINFKPRSFNPILTNKTLALSYPTERSLINVYSLAHDRNLEHMMENDDELPDVDSCMIPFSQSSRSLAKQASSQELKSLSKSSSLNSLEDSDSDTFEDEDDGPEPDINISGEAVLSKEKPKGQYWPARVIGYAGLKTLPQRGHRSKKGVRKEKYYRIEFCDGRTVDLPRSYFLTSDQAEFNLVSIGQVRSEDIKFENLVDKFDQHMSQLDLITKGQSSDAEIQTQHEVFLNNARTRGLIPREIRYGKYSETLIMAVGQHLKSRYISSEESTSSDAEGFDGLSNAQKSQYVFDILVPQLLWLVTIDDYKPDAEEELGSEATEEKIIARAKALALAEMQEADIVDRVYALRSQSAQVGARPEAGKRTLKRVTSTSRRASGHNSD